MMLNKTKLAVALATTVLLITGCEQQQSAQQHLQAAKKYAAEQQPSKALIELKNALSKNQELDQARFLLGQLYLQSGDFLAAEIEFNKLYNSDYQEPKLIVELAKARYLQQELATLPELWQQKKELSSSLLAQLGFYTYIALKQQANDSAISELKQSLIPAKQEQTYSKLILAYEQVEQQQVDTALNTVSNILLAEPTNTDALLFKGQLHIFQRDYNEAVVAFEQFLQQRPNYIVAKLYLADALFKDQQFDQAQTYIDQLVQFAPDFGYSNYLKGMLLFTQNKFEDAKLHLEKAIQAKTNVSESKLYAGLSAYRTEHFEQAYEYLTDIIDLVPNNDELRRLLSVVQFKLGYSIEASDSIAKLNELSERDLMLANEASFSYIQAGKTDKAKKLIEQASKVDSKNALEIAKLGMLKVSLQDMSGIVDIKKAIELDSSVEQAKVALVQAYLGQGLTDDALEVAEQWIHDEPGNIDGYNLAGFVAMQKQEAELAVKYFNKALELNKNNSASLMFFASKARAENDLKSAANYLNLLVSANPNYLPGLINNYLIAKQVGDVDNAVELFRLAHEKSPLDQSLALSYARVLYTEKHYREVVSLLTKMPKATPYEYRWLALFDSLFKLKEFGQARAEIEDWLSAFPKSERAWSAAIQLNGLTNPKTAIPLLKRAISHFADSPYLYTMLAEQHIKNKQIDKARLVLNNNLVGYKSDANVTVLQAKVLLIDNEIPQANRLLQSIYSENSSPELAILLAESYRKLGDNDKALAIIETSLTTYPNNLGLLFNKGNLYKKIDINQSIDIYKQVLAIEPKSVVTLNNLANAYLAVDQLELGYATAQQAVELAPQVVAIQSTMADAARLSGKLKQAENIYARLWLATNTRAYLTHYMQLANIKSEQAAIKALNSSQF